MGAGSSFNAAFLSEWRHDPNALRRAARVGNAAGRLKILSGQQPTRNRLLSFVEKEDRRQTVL